MRTAKINILFDQVIKTYDLKNDAELADFIDTSRGDISNLRGGRAKPGPSIILRLHEHALLEVRDIRRMLGDEVVK